jgi:hypothetical protein
MDYKLEEEGVVLSSFQENLHFFYKYLIFDFVMK